MRWHLCVTVLAIALGDLSLGSTEAAAQVLHTPHDHVPSFANPTIRNAASGPWSSASTWAPGGCPQPTDVVSIAHIVVYDSLHGDADVIGVEAGGVLRFSIDLNTQLRVGTLLVLPGGTTSAQVALAGELPRDQPD